MIATLAMGASLFAAPVIQQDPFAAFIAEPPPIGTPCEQDDLTGVWTSDLLGPSPDGRTAPPVLATDYMRFGSDGTMAYLRTTRQSLSLPELETQLDTIDRADGVTFTASIVRSGVLIVARDGRPEEGFTCTVVRNDAEHGELIWSQLRGRPPVFRHNLRLRR